MGSKIFYFSGTGNCLDTAREIAKALGECETIPMVKFRDASEVVEDGDVVGFVFPVNFLGVPGVVAQFVRRLKLKESAYVFAVATYGAMAGPVLADFAGLLKKNGAKLSAGYLLKMPDNYLITLNIPPPEELGRMLDDSKGQLLEIIEKVKNKEQQEIKYPGNLALSMWGGAFKWVSLNYYRASKRFWITDLCIGCGTCKKVCPLGNIEVIDKKVSWGNDCAQCLACVHWCPKEAIQIGGRTLKKKRYHHPDVTLKDMVRQAEEK